MLKPAHKTPLIDHGDETLKRAEIKHYFNATFDIYEKLFTTLASDDVFYLRPEPLRHPLIFYFGHTATFFINKLIVSKQLNQRLDARMESMMAIGVDEMSWDDLNEAHYDWPSVDAVRAYRARVRDTVNHLIDTLPLSLPIRWEDPFWIILMGIEHERIHLETSSVLIRQLPVDQVRIDLDWPLCPHPSSPAPTNELLPVTAGTVNLGRRKNATETYGWDNEFGSATEQVAAFKASRYLVSNAEFLAFVEEDGYLCERWWSEEGWRWVQYRQARHPLFWVPHQGSYRYRSMLQEIDMPWSWPVDVNYLEAKAFCNWLAARSGKPIRLPSEAEWYRLYDLSIHEPFPHWDTAPGNINLEHYASACPVDQFQQGDFHDVIGNVWQWTETPIDALPGFEVHPAYDDFSVPTFDGQHNLIKGGSWISTGNEAIRDSRYAFRRHFFQHAGFRYVESPATIEHSFNSYETDANIALYLEFHYGASYFQVPNYPATCVKRLLEISGESGFGRVLDIGCAVGRSSFELAQYAQHVDGVDFSTRFIRNALAMQAHGEVRYLIPTEGELTEVRSARLDELGLAAQAQKVHFSQGDACNLKPLYTDYDLIFAGNLIDRLYEPARFLSDMAWRLRPGGYLVLTSPYTWLEAYTDKENWLGGVREHGENLSSFEAIRRLLSAQFELVGDAQDIEFVLRETSRKFQHSLAQMSVWKKVR